MPNLHEKKCLACEGIGAALNDAAITDLIAKLNPTWQLSADKTSIKRRFDFKGFAKTIGFVNAVAWIASQENHHPDVQFGYNYCEVIFTTHALKGLSENDFICAAKVDLLLS